VTEPTETTEPNELSTAVDSSETSGPVEPEVESSPDETGQRPRNKEELYRKQRAQLKSENEALRERLNVLQRAEATRLASEHLQDGADLFLDGSTQLEDLLNEDTGDVDATKVADVSKQLVESRPHWKRRSPAAPPASSVTSRDKIGDGPDAPTWSEILQRKLR
jgi:hypothetical protein